MKRFSTVALQAAALALAAGGLTTGAYAQDSNGSVPKKWNYEIKDGKRVPKPSSRVVNPDGSWREEIRKGNCRIIKEKSAAGVYKETRDCD